MSVKVKSTWRPLMADVGLGRGRLLDRALGRLPSGCGKLGHLPDARLRNEGFCGKWEFAGFSLASGT